MNYNTWFLYTKVYLVRLDFESETIGHMLAVL